MSFILGKKIGMSQVFDQNGKCRPVTLVEAGPCYVSQIKTREKDGYQAVQLAFEKTKESRLSKAQLVHLQKAGLKQPFRYLREFPNGQGLSLGQEITISQFKPGDRVKVSGTSKGKGFQGVVKRHGFAGGPASHGTKHTLRAPGSIGSAFPQRVWKGKLMAGRTGGQRITTGPLKIIELDQENNLMALQGAVPGPRGALLEIVRVKSQVEEPASEKAAKTGKPA